MKVRYSKPAARQLFDIHAYIADRNPGAARKVVESIDRLVHRLATFPEIGRPIHGRDARAISVVDYPYVVFYRVKPQLDEVQILQIRHTSRRPLKRFGG